MTPWLMGVRAVVFDAVGTLIHPDPPAADVYAAVGRRFGSRLTPAEVAPRFRAAFAREEAMDRRRGLRTSEFREEQRWRDLVAAVLDDATDCPACFQELFEHFSRPGAWRCEPEAAVTLREMAGRGYTLGLASNYDSRLRPVAAGLSGLELVRHLIISSEVGWRKPAPEFFAAVVRQVGAAPEQVLYVGDDRENDYEGARALGLRAVLFDPKGEEADAGVQRITRLTDLLAAEGPGRDAGRVAEDRRPLPES